MGNAAIRTKILNKAAEIQKSEGKSTEDIIQGRVQFNASKKGIEGASIVNTRLQDAKVNQAIDLRQMVDKMYDPVSGEYKIPPSLHSELALGLARLLSPSGQVGIELMKELKQKTGREALSSMLIYAGADPAKVGGSTQSVIQMFIDSVDRQGEVAEDLRNTYVGGAKGATVGNSFKEYLKKSPTYKKPQDQSQIEGLPQVGQTFQGGKVLKITPIP
jgi:hypothetical protein